MYNGVVGDDLLGEDEAAGSTSSSDYEQLLAQLEINDNTGPIGFFWDLENCQVPSSKSALHVVQSLRAKFKNVGREMEFIVVCDVTKESANVINDFNSAQVTVIHVAAVSKNAADEKLKSCLRKFSHTLKSPGVVVLISGDVNFAPDLNDLRHRFGFSVVILHGADVSESLLVTANAHYSFHQFLEDVPEKSNLPKKNKVALTCLVRVSNLPAHIPSDRIRERLRRLCDNCGGRVLNVDKTQGVGYIRYPNSTSTQRSVKRLQGEDVFGSRIHVALAPPLSSLQPVPVSNMFTPLTAAAAGAQASSSSSSVDSDVRLLTAADVGCGKCQTTGSCECSNVQPQRHPSPPVHTSLSIAASPDKILLRSNHHCQQQRTVNNSMVEPSPLLLNGSRHEPVGSFGLGTSALPAFTADPPLSVTAQFAGPSHHNHQTRHNTTDTFMYGFGRGNPLPANNISTQFVITPTFSQPTGDFVQPARMRHFPPQPATVDNNVNADGVLPRPPAPLTDDQHRRLFRAEESDERPAVLLRVDNLDTSLSKREIEDGLRRIFTVYTNQVRVTNVDIDTGCGQLYALVHIPAGNSHFVSNIVNVCSGVQLGQQCIGVTAVNANSDTNSDGAFETRAMSSGAEYTDTEQPSLDVLDLVDDDQEGLLLDAIKECAVQILREHAQPLPLPDLLSMLRAALRSLSLIGDDTDAEPIQLADLRKLRDVVQLNTAANGRILCRLVQDPYGMYNRQNSENAPSQMAAPAAVASSAAAATASDNTNQTGGEGPSISRGSQFCEELQRLLSAQTSLTLPVSRFNVTYEAFYGRPFQLADYSAKSFTQLVRMCEPTVTMTKVRAPDGVQPPVLSLCLSEREQRHIRTQHICYLFVRKPDLELSTQAFSDRFADQFGVACDAAQLCASFSHVIKLNRETNTIRLVPAIRFALRARILLLNCPLGQMNLSEFEGGYERRYKQTLRVALAEAGFAHLSSLIKSVNFILYLKNRGQHTFVCINTKFLAHLKAAKPDVIIPGFRQDKYFSGVPQQQHQHRRRTASNSECGGFANAIDLAANNRSQSPGLQQQQQNRRREQRGSSAHRRRCSRGKTAPQHMAHRVQQEMHRWPEDKVIELEAQKQMWNDMGGAVGEAEQQPQPRATSTPKEHSLSHNSSRHSIHSVPYQIPYSIQPAPSLQLLSAAGGTSSNKPLLIRPCDLMKGTSSVLNDSCSLDASAPSSSRSAPGTRTHSRLAARFDNLPC